MGFHAFSILTDKTKKTTLKNDVCDDDCDIKYSF